MKNPEISPEASDENPKTLYEVLLHEYEKLEVFSPAEIEEIRAEEKRHEYFGSDVDEKRIKLGSDMLRLIRRRIHAKVEENEKLGKPFAALCLSGGGIRSATFGLGILQGLARHNLLDKFHYLSSVSGGGYIASWLSAWIYRKRVRLEEDGHPLSDEIFSAEFADRVQKDLALENIEDVEPVEISHLRAYSNYMSPRPGLFTTDTWTLVAVYLRNLLLNWTVFVPLIAAMLLLPRVFYAFLALFLHDRSPGFTAEETVAFVTSFVAGSFAVAAAIVMRPTLRDTFWAKPVDLEGIEKAKTLEARVRTVCVFLVFLFAHSLTSFWVWFDIEPGTGLPSILYFIAFGAAVFPAGVVLAVIYAFVHAQIKSKNPPKNTEEKRETRKRTFYRGRELLTSLLSGALGGAMLYLIVYLLEKLSVGYALSQTTLLLIYACFGIPLFLIVFQLTAVVFVGIASKITDDMDREWLSRFGGVTLIIVIGWALISTIVLFGPKFVEGLLDGQWIRMAAGSIGAISGLITLILGFSKKSPAQNEKEPPSNTGFLLWFAPQVAAPVFAVFLLILITYATYSLMKLTGEHLPAWAAFSKIQTGSVFLDPYPGIVLTLGWVVLLALLGGLMGWWVNVNKFSLHATYRERLIRAYLGASRAKERATTANHFTGLDSLDNLEMKYLRHKPFHVVNMTLNLVKTTNLRWQNRKAESFTATALFCGSSNMDNGNGSYRPSREYGMNQQNGKNITLGTAAAISGAAASPNMGYYTSSFAVSFLMALFNVRLGWWLGNPGKTGADTYKLAAPRWSPKVFFAEALGMTDDRHKYVYLSDGGHFDNLGLYEMVLRRCHLILVCDAGADLEFGFSDFGTAIHKIRVDMGIPIEFKSRRDAPTPGRNCGIATIKYSDVDGSDPKNDGVLIYVKPTLDGDEPIDIVNYKSLHPAFPHESTADQMYSETQFESYRKLGSHMINSFCCQSPQMPCTDCMKLSDLRKNAERYLKDFEERQKSPKQVQTG